MQPGARGSTNRTIEFGETTSQYRDGWIVPTDELTLSAQRYTLLDKTAFNEFDAAYAVDSLTVTIEPGEAFVNGWIARDTAISRLLQRQPGERSYSGGTRMRRMRSSLVGSWTFLKILPYFLI